MDLKEKRLLVAGTGETTAAARSVAWLASRLGARVMLVSPERAGSLAADKSSEVSRPWEVLQIDVTAHEAGDALQRRLSDDWAEVDGAVLAIPSGSARASSTEATPGRGTVTDAFRRTTYSLNALARAVLPLMPPTSEPRASIVGLAAAPQGGGGRAAEACAAALESVNRYLACALGPRGVRVNLVRAAVAGSSGEPSGVGLGDPDPATRAVCFLLSDWARAVTGEVLRVGAVDAPRASRWTSSPG